MNTILVWVLVGMSNGHNSTSAIPFSNPVPPFADMQECERVRKIIFETSGRPQIMQCIQMRIAKLN